MDDPEVRARFTSLAIPPAWTDVWISPFLNGHIQATGTDAAGRRQYIYHPQWRERKDREKFDRIVELAKTLPHARKRVTRALRQATDERALVMAAAFRMLDVGALRIGSERYAEDSGSRGLSTLLCSHVKVHGDAVSLSFPAKSGQRWKSELTDADLAAFVSWRLSQPARGSLLSWSVDGRRRAATADEINAYVRELTGDAFSAKDFRTLRGTIAAAVSLASAGPVESVRAQSSAISRAMEEASIVLGNTPAIARKSYVDPRVLDRYRAGETIDRRNPAASESALVALLGL